jgi:hypothetical protein
MTHDCWHGLIIKDSGDVVKCPVCNVDSIEHKLPDSVKIVKVVKPAALSFGAPRVLVTEQGKTYLGTVLSPVPQHVENALGYATSGYFYARREPSGAWTILNRIEDQEW